MHLKILNCISTFLYLLMSDNYDFNVFPNSDSFINLDYFMSLLIILTSLFVYTYFGL